MSIERSDEGTFWITTGMFPHEFIVSFPRPVQLFRIKTLTKHGAFSLLALSSGKVGHIVPFSTRLFSIVFFRTVRKISLERCEKPQPNAFEKVYEVGTSDAHQLPQP